MRCSFDSPRLFQVVVAFRAQLDLDRGYDENNDGQNPGGRAGIALRVGGREGLLPDVVHDGRGAVLRAAEIGHDLGFYEELGSSDDSGDHDEERYRLQKRKGDLAEDNPGIRSVDDGSLEVGLRKVLQTGKVQERGETDSDRVELSSQFGS